jgi:hypothetical protein
MAVFLDHIKNPNKLAVWFALLAPPSLDSPKPC